MSTVCKEKSINASSSKEYNIKVVQWNLVPNIPPLSLVARLGPL